MDLIDRLKDAINEIPNLPLKIRKGALSVNESLVIYPLPGSRPTQNYMDGAKDANINLEIAMSSKDGSLLESTLWKIQDFLDQLTELPSQDGSYQFNNLEITSKPFISKLNEQGWLVFQMSFYVNVTTKEDKKTWLKN